MRRQTSIAPAFDSNSANRPAKVWGIAGEDARRPRRPTIESASRVTAIVSSRARVSRDGIPVPAWRPQDATSCPAPPRRAVSRKSAMIDGYWRFEKRLNLRPSFGRFSKPTAATGRWSTRTTGNATPACGRKTPRVRARMAAQDAEAFESLNSGFHHHSAKAHAALRLLKTPSAPNQLTRQPLWGSCAKLEFGLPCPTRMAYSMSIKMRRSMNPNPSNSTSKRGYGCLWSAAGFGAIVVSALLIGDLFGSPGPDGPFGGIMVVFVLAMCLLIGVVGSTRALFDRSIGLSHRIWMWALTMYPPIILVIAIALND